MIGGGAVLAAVLLFGPQTPLAPPAPRQFAPALFNANGAIIALWSDGERVYGRGRNGNTAVLPGVPPAGYAAAAANSLWVATTNANGIAVRSFTLDLEPIGEPIVIDRPSPALLAVSVAAAGDDALVVWTQTDPMPAIRVGAMLITSDGARQIEIPSDDDSPHAAIMPTASWNGDDFLAAWMKDGPGLLCSPCPWYGKIFAVRIGRDGALRDAAPIPIFDGYSFGGMQVVPLPGAFGVAWGMFDGLNGVILRDGPTQPPQQWIAGNVAHYALAQRGEGIAAVWMRTGDRIEYRLIDGNGLPDPEIGLLEVAGGSHSPPAIAAFGATVVVAYVHPDDPNVPGGPQRIDARTSRAAPRARVIR